MTTTASQTPQPSRKPRSPRVVRTVKPADLPVATIAKTPAAKPLTARVPKPRERSEQTKPSPPHVSAPPPTKHTLLIALLERKGGATIDELKRATGWQAHSVRGTMSGILKKRLGLTVQAELKNGVRHYQIITSA